MKKINLVLLCFIFPIFHNICSGQNQNKIDSLLHILKTAKEDTTKANTLNALGWELRYSNPDTSIILASQALSLSKKATSKKHIADSYHVIAWADYMTGNYPSSLENNFKALSLRQELADKPGIAKSIVNIGDVYSVQGNYSKALDYFFKALKMQEELADKSAIAKSFRNIGLVYKDQTDYPKTLNYYFKALKMEEELADKSRIANTLGNIGMVYAAQGDYPKALDYFFKSLKVAEELGNKHGIAWILQMIGVIYEQLNDASEAIKNFKAALKIQEKIGDKVGAAQTHNSIGNHYFIQSKYPDALQQFFAAEKIFRELGNLAPAWGIPWCYVKVGEIYEKQGDIALAAEEKASSERKYSAALKKYLDALKIHETTKFATAISQDKLYIGNIYIKLKKFSLAKSYLEKGLHSSKAENDKENLKTGYEYLSNLNNLQGNFRQAFDYYKLYITFRDSLVNGENVKKSTQLMMNYEFEKTQAAEKAGHEKQLAVADVAIKKQTLLKNSFIGGLALALVLFFFIYKNYHTRQKLKLETIRNNIAADLHDDIGSTLNSISIYSEVAKKKDEQQDEALEMIGDASRKIIDAMSDIVWTINPDNDSFAKIIFRMKSLAYNLFRAKKIEFTFHSDEILDKKKLSLEVRRNFYLIFKEAVNNLVKYSNATRAVITLSNENDNIKLRIQDDGVGFDTSEEIIGNGLKNMKRRADEMKAQFKIESGKGNGTQIELILKA